jgi:hypothetical protein
VFISVILRNKKAGQQLLPGFTMHILVLASAILLNQGIDTLVWIQQGSNGAIMIQGIDDVSNVLAHVTADVVITA